MTFVVMDDVSIVGSSCRVYVTGENLSAKADLCMVICIPVGLLLPIYYPLTRAGINTTETKAPEDSGALDIPAFPPYPAAYFPGIKNRRSTRQS